MAVLCASPIGRPSKLPHAVGKLRSNATACLLFANLRAAADARASRAGPVHVCVSTTGRWQAPGRPRVLVAQAPGWPMAEAERTACVPSCFPARGFYVPQQRRPLAQLSWAVGAHGKYGPTGKSVPLPEAVPQRRHAGSRCAGRRAGRAVAARISAGAWCRTSCHLLGPRPRDFTTRMLVPLAVSMLGLAARSASCLRPPFTSFVRHTSVRQTVRARMAADALAEAAEEALQESTGEASGEP